MSEMSAVEVLYFEALSRSTPPERAAYLDEACAGDAKLRRQVERLLAAEARLGDFLQEPAAVLAGTTAEGAALATLRASVVCEVGEEIGRGGMGCVLRVRDAALDRDLAVKVLLPGLQGRPELERRFLEEARITGRLQHPGVVPVHQVGTLPDRRPFFTMKLVQGQTFAHLLGERRSPADELPRLLGVFAAVCQTMAFAHSQGVIHRDLKPLNIMVGSFGEVQVMDWGLAKDLAPASTAEMMQADASTVVEKVAEGTPGTSAGTVLGTPAYMAPEQARGEAVDERADVFGLGAILCEILTGQPPFTVKGSEPILRARRADLAQALLRLDSCGAEGELAALCKVCLSAGPQERPRHGGEVADAITAYQRSVAQRLREAETARAEALVRAAEERKRRRLALALAGTVLLGLTLGGGTWLWLRADRDARLVQQTREVTKALTEATALREKAKVAGAGSAALFAQAREQVRLARTLAEGGPVDPALLAGVRQLQADIDLEEKDRRLLADLDAAYLAQTHTHGARNRFALERAVPLFRKAFARYGLAAGQGEPAEAVAHLRRRPAAVRLAAVAALEEWADLAADQGYQITEPHRAWLVAVAEAAESANGWSRQFRAARTQRDLAGRREALRKLAEPAHAPELLAAVRDLARRLTEAGCPADAVQLLRRALRRHPDDFWLNERLGNASESAEAVRYLSVARALRPDSPGALLNLANALGYNRQPDEAIACYREALALDPEYSAAYNGLGRLLADKGEWDEAIDNYRKSIQLDPTYFSGHYNLARALAAKGKVDEAIACYHKAIELNRTDARPHANLGMLLFGKGELDRAAACFRRALDLDPKLPQAHLSLGNCLYVKGKKEEAVASYKKAVEFAPNWAYAHTNLGAALEGTGRRDEAIACHRKAVALAPNLANAQANLGELLSFKGQFDEAIACLGKAIALDPKHVKAHLSLSRALRGKGCYTEARDSASRALELLGAKDPLRPNATQQVRDCTLLVRLGRRLDDVLGGKGQAGSAQEGLELAEVCRLRRLHTAAARFAAAAFTAGPALAADLGAGHRYNAACSAALAAAGVGEDAGKLSQGDRQALRRQALTWLRAELRARQKQRKSWWPGEADKARAALRDWQKDADLAGLRDAEVLKRLSAEERQACQRLWADVAALLAKTAGGGPPNPGEQP